MKALVIGGTGPSGPYLVNGLIRRGYQVSVLHGGHHEVEFEEPVEHIHTDPHFTETLEPALEGRSFDLTIATYGRVRLIAETIKGKTERLITVGGGSVNAPRTDPRWGAVGSPLLIDEEGPLLETPDGGRKRSYLMVVTEDTVMRAHREGYYQATIFRYPKIYGPNAPANPEWSIVRRIRDKRERIIVSSSGNGLSRSFGENAAHCLLLAVDKPGPSSGQIFNVREQHQYTQRQIVEFVTRFFGYDCELVDLPPNLTRMVYSGGKPRPIEAGVNFDITKIRTLLGYEDIVPVATALERSVEWLMNNPPEKGGEIEKQLGDPFAYAAEDLLIQAYRKSLEDFESIEFEDLQSGHMYRHPKQPGEAWTPQGKR